MSRASRIDFQSGRPSFASHTTFEALAVEEGEEESEEEVEVECPSEREKVIPTPPPEKLSKTAQKKAAKAARLAKQLAKASKPLPEVHSAQSGITESTLHEPESPSSSYVAVDLPEDSNGPFGEFASIQPVLAPVDPGSLNGHADLSLITDARITLPAIEPPNSRAPAPDFTEAEPPIRDRKDGSVVSSPPPDVEGEEQKKRQNVVTRTLWSFIMIGGFVTLVLLGHAWMILLVMLCQTVVYREVTALFSLGVPKSEESNGKDPWSKTLSWYFFAVTNYFLYGESIIYYFKHVVFADAQMLPFATNHRFISFTLYTIGFVGFVSSLKKQYLKQQFGLFCWVHMSLLVIVVSSHFIVNNILEGLIWFWVPASLVICNDVFAYVWGKTFGRTPLIKLSPKKTVEGFVGAFFSTLLFGVLWGTYFMRFEYMICPVRELGVSAWSSVTCEPNPVFLWREWEMWPPLRVFASMFFGPSIRTIPYTKYQLHLLVMSCFASLVAPFGGFFASGFKRAFDVKDFGDSIPGHGGMTDRMDCQFLMGVWTYVYYSSIIREHHVTVGFVLQLIVSGLTLEEQLELMGDFRKYLEGRGITI